MHKFHGRSEVETICQFIFGLKCKGQSGEIDIISILVSGLQFHWGQEAVAGEPWFLAKSYSRMSLEQQFRRWPHRSSPLAISLILCNLIFPLNLLLKTTGIFFFFCIFSFPSYGMVIRTRVEVWKRVPMRWKVSGANILYPGSTETCTPGPICSLLITEWTAMNFICIYGVQDTWVQDECH